MARSIRSKRLRRNKRVLREKVYAPVIYERAAQLAEIGHGDTNFLLTDGTETKKRKNAIRKRKRPSTMKRPNWIDRD